MIRSAAKNHASVAVAHRCRREYRPSRRARRERRIPERGERATGSPRTRSRRTAQLRRGDRGPTWRPTRAPERRGRSGRGAFPAVRSGSKASAALTLRYGENPHQAAAFTARPRGPAVGLGSMRQLHGPELGYNNLLDFSAALSLLLEFDRPAAVVIKHTNPAAPPRRHRWAPRCSARRPRTRSRSTAASFGVNRTPSTPTVVESARGIFVEILFAPSYTPDALEELERTKQALPRFEVSCDRRRAAGAARRVPRAFSAGVLVQTADLDAPRSGGARDGDATGPDRRRARGASLRLARSQHAKSNADRAGDGRPGRSASAPGR